MCLQLLQVLKACPASWLYLLPRCHDVHAYLEWYSKHICCCMCLQLCQAREAFLRVEAHHARFQEALAAAQEAATAAQDIQKEVAAKEGPLK